MEGEVSLLCSQECATGPYPEPDASSLLTSHPISIRSILILSSHIRPCLSNGLSSLSCVTFHKKLFLRWGVVSPSPNTHTGGPPLLDCPRLLIQSCLFNLFAATPLYLEAFSSISKPSMRHLYYIWGCRFCLSDGDTSDTIDCRKFVWIFIWLRTWLYRTWNS
jgi:hypothetical protein